MKPRALAEIEVRAKALGFNMNSGWQVGQLLASLAASKPGGQVLELGTGWGRRGFCRVWMLMRGW